jgi:hypothetical protein
MTDIPVGGANTPLGPMHVESHQRSKDHIIDLEEMMPRRHFHRADAVLRTAGWKQWINLGNTSAGRVPMVMRLVFGNGGQVMELVIDWVLGFAALVDEMVLVAETNWRRNPFWAGLRLRQDNNQDYCIDFRIPVEQVGNALTLHGDWLENGLGWSTPPREILEDFGDNASGPGTVLVQIDPLVQGPNHLIWPETPLVAVESA